MFYSNLLGIPVLALFSIIAEDWGAENLARNLYVAPPTITISLFVANLPV